MSKYKQIPIQHTVDSWLLLLAVTEAYFISLWHRKDSRNNLISPPPHISALQLQANYLFSDSTKPPFPTGLNYYTPFHLMVYDTWIRYRVEEMSNTNEFQNGQLYSVVKFPLNVYVLELQYCDLVAEIHSNFWGKAHDIASAVRDGSFLNIPISLPEAEGSNQAFVFQDRSFLILKLKIPKSKFA